MDRDTNKQGLTSRIEATLGSSAFISDSVRLELVYELRSAAILQVHDELHTNLITTVESVYLQLRYVFLYDVANMVNIQPGLALAIFQVAHEHLRINRQHVIFLSAVNILQY
jgi:hypothetical protein